MGQLKADSKVGGELIADKTWTNTQLADKVDKEAGKSIVDDTEIAKIHTQDIDTYLDKGGTNEVTAANAKDAVTKKHTQNTDTGTTSDAFQMCWKSGMMQIMITCQSRLPLTRPGLLP